MKAVLLHGAKDVRLEDVPIPEISSGEILVKMVACGICGTDIEKFLGHCVTPPILGHEAVGVIAKVGEKVNGFQEGDRVFAHHHVPDYTCHFCRKGSFTMCNNFLNTNLDPCGFAEFYRVPEQNVRLGAVLKLPENVTYKEGVLIEPTACCLRGIQKFGIDPTDDVIVIGAGPVGLIHISLLKAIGVRFIIASDLIDWRLKKALSFGANYVLNPKEDAFVEHIFELTDGIGADVVIISTGSVKALQQGLELVRKGGTVGLFGMPPQRESLIYNANKLFIRETTIIPSYSTSELETNMALRMISTKRINLSDLITHQFKLKNINKAINITTQKRKVLKVLVRNDSK